MKGIRACLLIAALMLVAAGCSLFPQPQMGTVEGVVTLNGDVPGNIEIEVVAIGTSHKTKVNADGTYRIALPSPGQYSLQARGDGISSTPIAVSVGRGAAVTGVDIEAVYVPTSAFYLDLDNPTHVGLIERPWPYVEYSIKKDPFNETALFFPPGGSGQAPPAGAYPHMRFVLLNIPHIDDFEIAVKQIGEGGEEPGDELRNGGNRSLALIFGYQDPGNYWVAYFTYTGSTRVTHAVNGAGKLICSGTEGEWRASNTEYQEARISLSTVGDNKVLRAWVNGQESSLDGCTFPAEDYTPGKVGLGGHPTSTVQSWYFKDLYVDIK